MPSNTPPVPNNTPPVPNNIPPVPDNVLAFRAITHMLSLVQQEAFAVDEVPAASSLNRHERLALRLCNAFSTLAVIEHEVVAVVAKQTASGLEVIASTQLPRYKNSSSQQSGIGWKEFFITRNPWRSDLGNANLPKDVVLQSAEAMCPELDGILQDDAKFRTYVAGAWNNPTIARHLCIFPRLLTLQYYEADGKTLDPKTGATTLLEYVAATCYPKMLRRLKNKVVSVPNIDSLQNISTLRDMKPIVLSPSTDEEIESEQQFISAYAIPNVQRLGPKLAQQVKLAMDDEPYTLYTKDTAGDFHLMLVNLLTSFQKSLEALQKARGTSATPLAGTTKFKAVARLVALNGFALLKLAQSASLRVHFQTISPLLRHVIQEPTQDDWDETDSELKEVQPFIYRGTTQVPLWKSYRDWLRLMVAHFDAAVMLHGFYDSNKLPLGTSVSVKILYAPPIDPKILPQMLDWRKLFDKSGVFPTEGGDSENNNTNLQLLEFLTETSLMTSKLVDAERTWNTRKLAYTGKQSKALDTRPDSIRNILKPLIATLEELRTSKLPGKAERAELLDRLQEKLTSLIPVPSTDGNPSPFVNPDTDTCKEMTQLFQDLQAGLRFYKFLTLAEPPFTGTLHCEVLLASLLCNNTDITGYENIQKELQDFRHFIGVSKYCCPVCHQALRLLEDKFITSGTHNTVTACSLPTWLPKDVVDSMNAIFAEQLRKELIELKANPNLRRPRALSGGSHRLSSDSQKLFTPSVPHFSKEPYDDALAYE